MKGATGIRVVLDRLAAISIHAPVKGATNGYLTPEWKDKISIHAPVKGATMEGTTVVYDAQFQSTLP